MILRTTTVGFTCNVSVLEKFGQSHYQVNDTHTLYVIIYLIIYRQRHHFVKVFLFIYQQRHLSFKFFLALANPLLLQPHFLELMGLL